MMDIRINSVSRYLLSGLILLLLTSCSKENYLYVKKQSPHTDQSFKVKEMKGSSSVDILWVIDNSGSMDSYQREVVDNANIFMQEFIKEKLDWKMGLISTSSSEDPYVGFSGTPQLNSSIADPIDVFIHAVNRLGTYGSGREETFRPILRALSDDPTFLRPNTPLAVIMVTDAPEQSSISVPSFLSDFSNLTQGRNLFAYGVFAAGDMNCSTDDDEWDYKDSPYEGFINSAMVGQTFPLCKDFGNSLLTISKDIVTRVSHTAIYLTSRPDTSTLKVIYQGKELPAGPMEMGGVWVYDYRLNAVVFNNLDFAKNDTDSVRVVFEEQR